MTVDLSTTIARLRELEAAATKGPWFHNGIGVGDARSVWNTDGGGKIVPHRHEVQVCVFDDDDQPITKSERDANIRLIAECRNAIIPILDRLAAVEAERDALLAQMRATGHVPYLERMSDLAARAEKAEAERDELRAALTTPEVYAGVVGDAMENEIAGLHRDLAEARAELAKCLGVKLNEQPGSESD